MTDLFNLRRDFTLKTLDEYEMKASPIAMFELWLAEAMEAKALEPNAMNLATVDKNGRPSSRIVLLKKITPQGFTFFTNYESNKAKQIEENKYCALNFVWHELERQVRVEGTIEKVSKTDSDSYFNARPTDSKLGAWASPQSQPIPNRDYLDILVERTKAMFDGKENIERPTNWGGYVVTPTLIEFWQGRPNRLHDRMRYKLDNDGAWKLERLAP